MVYRDTSSELVQLHSDSLPQSNILCIIKDFTDALNPCKNQTITLPSSFTVRQLIQEVAKLYFYEENSFLLKWKVSNELIDIKQFSDTPRTLSEIGLFDQNKRNQFEIHEKDDGPPIKLSSDSGINNNSSSTIYDMYTCERPPTPSISSSTYTPTKTNFSFSNNEEPTGYVGLINQAMTCYLNSLLQTLYMTPEFRNAIYRWKYTGNPLNNDETRKNIPFQLQRLFLKLQTSKKRSIETNDLTQAFGWSSDDAFQQHDVQELCRVMFDALEKMFKGTKQENLINELYQGVVKDFVKCNECNTENARSDVYLDIQLSIIKQNHLQSSFSPTSNILDADASIIDSKYYHTLEDALDAHVECEILDGSNKYKCSVCNKLCVASKGFSFQSIPYILCIQLKRFDFDYQTMSRIKLNAQVKFPFKLDMSKYVLNDQENIEYELFSIMIHSGSAIGGHYYAYIKNLDSSNDSTQQWFNFNDERVSYLDMDDIKRAYGVSYSSYSSTCAYMLFYRQINSNKNEKFLNTDELPEHIKQILDLEEEFIRNEAKLKEDLANQVKIRCYLNDENKLPKNDKIISLNKTHTIEMIEKQLANEYLINLNEYSYHRLLKYDIQNNLILANLELDCILKDIIQDNKTNNNYYFTTQTPLNSSNVANNPLPIGLILEYSNKPFEYEYTEESLVCRIVSIDLDTYEINENILNDYLRLSLNSTFIELTNIIRASLGLADEVPLRLAYESYSHFSYLNDFFEPQDELKIKLTQKINRIYIEYKHLTDFSVDFKQSKFYYALNTILKNLFTASVYLPTEEQCNIYKRKQLRRLDLLNSNIIQREANNQTPPPPSYDEVISQTNTNTSLSLKRRFSFETQKSSRRNAITTTNQSDMETSLDEGIGSNSPTNQLKSSLNSLDNIRGSCNDLNAADLSDDDEDANHHSHNLNNHTTSFNQNTTTNNNDDNDYDMINVSNNKHQQVLDYLNDPKDEQNQAVGNYNPNDEDWDADIAQDNTNKMDYTESNIINDIYSHEKYIKSSLNSSNEFGTRILDIKMDKRLTLYEFKRHLELYLNLEAEQFRLFRLFQNDIECEITHNESQFLYLAQQTKFIIKLGPACKYGEYLVPIYKMNKNIGFSYLCDFMITHGMNVYDHKLLLCQDLKDECGLDLKVDEIRLRKKHLKYPSNILIDTQLFGQDIFINNTTELCIEQIDCESKLDATSAIVYIRKWIPSKYELGPLEELCLQDSNFNTLMQMLSIYSKIELDYLEVLRCRREYPYKSPILDIHKDSAWRENYLLQKDRIEDGFCFYYRDKRELLGELDDEKRRELAKEDSINFKSTSSYVSRKETGVKIHI